MNPFEPRAQLRLLWRVLFRPDALRATRDEELSGAPAWLLSALT